MFLIALSTLAFAAPDAGSGAVRLTGGAGTSEVGAAVRAGLEGEVWVLPRLAVGARAAGGIDGLDTGRMVVVGEALMPIRALGGEALSIVITPGLGVVDRYEYDTDVALSTAGVSIDPGTEHEGLASSASIAAGLYGRMSVVSVTLGPRIETYAFRTSSTTLQLGLGLGW